MTETQQLSLTRPLAEAWGWMVRMLFRPFDAGKWLVVGFAAWLAGLASGGGGGSGNISAGDGRAEVVDGFHRGWEWLMDHEVVAGLIFAGILVLLAIVVVLLWVSSRGKFVFLDNVVRDRAAIVEPWKRYRRQGNSLFAFRLIVLVLCLPLALGVVGLLAWLTFGPDGWARLDGPAMVAGIGATVLLGFALVVTTLYAVFFLDAFVVPLMYHFDLGVLAAWRRFLGLLRARPGWFLLVGLFVFVLTLAAGSAIFVTGCMTCCLGFLLLMLPYVGTVVLLPLIVFYRAFTLSFLAQLEPELALRAAETAP
jgi:hypothetical protein